MFLHLFGPMYHIIYIEDYECSENEFKCHRGPCIDHSLVCNNQVDCDMTWDDEDNCRKILKIV